MGIDRKGWGHFAKDINVRSKDCETCKHYKLACELFSEICKYEPKDEAQTIRCPKCGRSDYIREFGKDFSVTAEEAGFKYKCINCNTYIEPQTDCPWK